MTKAIALLPVCWSRPTNVGVAVTLAGSALAPNRLYGEANMALHVGDAAEAVVARRQQLAAQLKVPQWQWLEQVHGIAVVEACLDNAVPKADACFTRQVGVACTVMTADCLPVFFCNSAGTQVAVAHAGWRGLAEGVLAKTRAAFAADAAVLAYLGPAIGAQVFEVGADVKAVFEHRFASIASLAMITACFAPSPYQLGHYLADIYALARLQLNALGVLAISGGEHCTLSDSRFYSYRREATTGRMASVIWLQS
ncbi:MAG: peptidoglycan editing factor PgeF [Marinagarivorans sp.]|nr:peptidoglycan editing factor PgeF [Marinagarivorans sp.]